MKHLIARLLGASLLLSLFVAASCSNPLETDPPPEMTTDTLLFVDTLIKTNCIDEPTKIWWDVRPHPRFPTLEFRVTDICTKLDEAICLASLILAITAKLIKLRYSNRSWRRYRHHLVNENKWRAVRWGIEGKLIDFGKKEEVAMPVLTEELLEFVDDVLDDLGIRDEVGYVNTILSGGTSADRQIKVFEDTEDLQAVVDHVVAETREGCF